MNTVRKNNYPRRPLIALPLLVFFESVASHAAGRLPENSNHRCTVAQCIKSYPAFDHWDLARRIKYGYGMSARDELAFIWYQKAASMGDGRAMHNVGLMLMRGQGVHKDILRGQHWLERSLSKGQSESAMALGNHHRRTGNFTKAVQYYSLAADRGDSRAMNALANMRLRGLGTETNKASAYVLYKFAAEKGHEAANQARVTLRRDLSLKEQIEVQMILREKKLK
jgi:TPR repeat protein